MLCMIHLLVLPSNPETEISLTVCTANICSGDALTREAAYITGVIISRISELCSDGKSRADGLRLLSLKLSIGIRKRTTVLLDESYWAPITREKLAIFLDEVRSIIECKVCTALLNAALEGGK